MTSMNELSEIIVMRKENGWSRLPQVQYDEDEPCKGRSHLSVHPNSTFLILNCWEECDAGFDVEADHVPGILRPHTKFADFEAQFTSSTSESTESIGNGRQSH